MLYLLWLIISENLFFLKFLNSRLISKIFILIFFPLEIFLINLIIDNKFRLSDLNPDNLIFLYWFLGIY